MSAPPFTRPQGDPGSILAAASKIGAVATGGQTALTTFTGATTGMLKDWDTPVATEFAQLAGSHTVRLTAAVEQVEGAAGAVKGYGDALRAVQESIDALTAAWNGQQRTVEERSASGEPLPGRSEAIREQARIEGDASRELDRFDRTRRSLTTMLDDSTGVLVAAPAGKNPEQLFGIVMGAWTQISPEVKLGLTGGKVVGIVTKATPAVKAVRTYADANRAETLLRQTRGLALATAKVLLQDGGRYNRIPGQVGVLARDIRDAKQVADGARTVAESRYLNFYKAAVPVSRFSKGLAIAGIAGGAYDLIANPLDETGARRGVSVTMDVVGIGASGVGLAAAAGLVTLGPVGVGIVAGALVVTAAWGVGTYVYDHWDDIEKGVSTATKWVGDQATKATKKVTNGVRNMVGGVGKAVSGLFS
ncbi:MAG: hypothetical protein QG622_2786 [Actinomycetota bacterium]|nr:hypothetical protein [Actinomycetota bacterium]